MTSEKYKNKNGAFRFRPVLNSDDQRQVLDGNIGFCIGCGTEASGVEPDAVKYRCENCDCELVYGLEELVLMGLAKVL